MLNDQNVRVQRAIHSLNGNCWEHRCRQAPTEDGALCDQCHVHAQPRGECSACAPCCACEAEFDEAADAIQRACA